MKKFVAIALAAGFVAAASAQVDLVAVENPAVSDGSSRAFDLTITVPADRNFAAAEIIGTSANGDFRNQDGVFNFAFVFNDVDSWMTAPRFHPTNNGVPAATLIGAPTNSFTNTDINWAWADDPNQAVADLDGVIARIMLANGGEGTLTVQVAGTLVQGGSWSEAFTLVIPEPTTLSLLALGGLAGLIRRR